MQILFIILNKSTFKDNIVFIMDKKELKKDKFLL